MKKLCIILAIVMMFCMTGCENGGGGAGHPDAPSVSGANKVYQMDYPADVVFSVDLKGKQIESIINKTLYSLALNSSDYAVDNGNLVIKSAYLNNLGGGNFDFVLTTEGGTADFSITVNAMEQWNTPATADVKASNSPIKYVNEIGVITGKNAKKKSTKDWGVGATDLGFPFYDAEIGRLFVCFGDTFAGDFVGQGQWNNNAILYTDNLDLSGGIDWKGVIKTGRPLDGTNADFRLQVTPERSDTSLVTPKTSTCIPTGVVVLDGAYYLFYMEVNEHNFAANGEWEIYNNRVMKSTDRGLSWNQVSTLKWESTTAPETAGTANNFGQIFPILADDGYVYIYGIPGGRRGGTQLGRVLKENIENQSEYEYFVMLQEGNPLWLKGSNGLSALAPKNSTSFVMPPTCGELSMVYNAYLKKYVATYQSGAEVVLRMADKPWGPFSTAYNVTDASKYPNLYGAFSNSIMTTHNGRRMYFIMSQWTNVGGNFYNTKLLEIVFD